ncbi:MAG TPA: hypothetical protein VF736_13840 [Pyrinomonadaceae bacterium]|jgi:hypothetical protein
MTDATARERREDTEAGTVVPGLRVPFSADPASRGRLLKLVAAKLALDLLFVCALAAYARSDAFRTDFSGEVEPTDGRVVRGWVSDGARPGAVVEVQLFVDGRFAATAFADEPAPAGAGSGGGARRGFVFELGPRPGGTHEARVYAVCEGRGGARRTLQLVGAPRSFVRR